MYGDPQRLRVLASLLEEEGHRVDAGATRLARNVAALRWESTAAGQMRQRAGAQVQSMREVARRYADAAAVVRHHAVAVEQQLDRIRRIEATVHALAARLAPVPGAGAAASVAGALGGSGLGSGGLGDLGGLPLPPAGHRDWLAVPARLAAAGIAL